MRIPKQSPPKTSNVAFRISRILRQQIEAAIAQGKAATMTELVTEAIEQWLLNELNF